MLSANERLLERAGRIQLGSGILPMLVYEFSCSPTMTNPERADILCDLLESFYFFKGECESEYSDEELLEMMHRYFDDATIGGLERAWRY